GAPGSSPGSRCEPGREGPDRRRARRETDAVLLGPARGLTGQLRVRWSWVLLQPLEPVDVDRGGEDRLQGAPGLSRIVAEGASCVRPALQRAADDAAEALGLDAGDVANVRRHPAHLPGSELGLLGEPAELRQEEVVHSDARPVGTQRL